jgi:hypothetical protein
MQINLQFLRDGVDKMVVWEAEDNHLPAKKEK